MRRELETTEGESAAAKEREQKSDLTLCLCMVNRLTPSWPLSWLSWPLFNLCPAVSVSDCHLSSMLCHHRRASWSPPRPPLLCGASRITQRQSHVAGSEAESCQQRGCRRHLLSSNAGSDAAGCPDWPSAATLPPACLNRCSPPCPQFLTSR